MSDSIEKIILLLAEKVSIVIKKLERIEQKTLPDRLWYDLKSLCEIKNISYKTLCQKKYLQPNFGEPDNIIAGKKQWTITTILNTKWLYKSDAELLNEYQAKQAGFL